MNHTKIYTAGLDSPCEELFVRGFEFVVALLIFWELISLCVCTCLVDQTSVMVLGDGLAGILRVYTRLTSWNVINSI